MGLRDRLAAAWRWFNNPQPAASAVRPASAVRESFGIVPMGYDLAAAFYERGLAAVGNTALTVFLVQEVYEPFACSLVGLSPAMADIADSKVSRALAIWQECKKTGIWPAYLPRIHYAEPMPWQIADEEEAAVDGAYDELQEREGLQI